MLENVVPFSQHLSKLVRTCSHQVRQIQFSGVRNSPPISTFSP